MKYIIFLILCITLLGCKSETHFGTKVNSDCPDVKRIETTHTTTLHYPQVIEIANTDKHKPPYRFVFDPNANTSEVIEEVSEFFTQENLRMQISKTNNVSQILYIIIAFCIGFFCAMMLKRK